jgi:hypothetical protein
VQLRPTPRLQSVSLSALLQQKMDEETDSNSSDLLDEDDEAAAAAAAAAGDDSDSDDDDERPRHESAPPAAISFISPYRFSVHTDLLALELVNSDGFLNIHHAALDPPALRAILQECSTREERECHPLDVVHGLLGSSAERSAHRSGRVTIGSVDDYRIPNGDLFGAAARTEFNRFAWTDDDENAAAAAADADSEEIDVMEAEMS